MSVWFITGSSRGFGWALVEAALEQRNSVVATARRPEQLQDFIAAHPNDALALPLDVSDGGAVMAAIRTGAERFGRIDVVVNNVGYANVAPIETGDETDFRTQSLSSRLVQLRSRQYGTSPRRLRDPQSGSTHHRGCDLSRDP